jgi:hypothetical protein
MFTKLSVSTKGKNDTAWQATAYFGRIEDSKRNINGKAKVVFLLLYVSCGHLYFVLVV